MCFTTFVSISPHSNRHADIADPRSAYATRRYTSYCNEAHACKIFGLIKIYLYSKCHQISIAAQGRAHRVPPAAHGQRIQPHPNHRLLYVKMPASQHHHCACAAPQTACLLVLVAETQITAAAVSESPSRKAESCQSVLPASRRAARGQSQQARRVVL